MHKKIMIFGLVAALSACAWHLQGHVDTGSVELKTLSLSSDNIYSPLYRTFRVEYERRRIQLVDAANGTPVLRLLDEKPTVRILSLNTELDPAEDEISLLIDYQINMPNQLPQFHEIQLYRTYTQNKNRAAARDNERAKLIDEMRREAAEKILIQITTLLQHSPSPAVTP